MSESKQNETVFDDESMHVGQVYAKALLGASQASGKVDEIVAQFDSFVHDVLDKQPALETALANPRLAVEEKIRVLEKAFSKK